VISGHRRGVEHRCTKEQLAERGVKPLRVRGRVDKAVTFVVAEYKRVEVSGPSRIPTDDEFLARIDAHLEPSS